MTMPSLIAKHQKQVTLTKLKKAYSILGQTVTKSFADNGPVELSGKADADVTKEFFETYWLKYFNGAKVANNRDTIYGLERPFKYLDYIVYDMGVYTSYSQPRVLFTANDGINYFIYMTLWGEDGTANYSKYSMIVFVDVNGTQGPNMFGKDVFEFFVDYKDLRVRPYNMGLTAAAIDQECKSKGESCAAKIMKDGWQMTSEYPW